MVRVRIPPLAYIRGVGEWFPARPGTGYEAGSIPAAPILLVTDVNKC